MKNTSNVFWKILTLFFCSFTIWAQGPRVLIVTAHPDDETMFPATIFKITHELIGIVDLALITDASGGYNGLVASTFYGKNLTDSAVGRNALPLIRKKELLCSGEVMGIRNFYFFDQLDDYYQIDPKPFFEGKRWDMAFCEKKLNTILENGKYDYVICLVPSIEQHAHHKTASILAIRAVQKLKLPVKPIVLGGKALNKNYTFKFESLPDFPETKILVKAPVFYFDRSFGFGEENKHSYMIVADWVKACHKSQSGDMNSSMHKGDLETFWYFDINPEKGIDQTAKFFEKIRNAGFQTK
jgi:N-acetylglucosamine malate deacetylase 2